MIPVHLRWPIIIVSALAIHVVASVVVVLFAISDPSRAIEPDYYQKALAWNQKRAQDARNDELGWKLPFEALASSPGSVQIRAQLVDGEGVLLKGARISVSAFHNARAAHILRSDLMEEGDGWYAATLPMHRSGRWELSFLVEHQDQTFTLVENRHITAGRSG